MELSWRSPKNQLLLKFLELQSFTVFKESYCDNCLSKFYLDTIKPIANFTSVDQMSFDTVFNSTMSIYYCEVQHIVLMLLKRLVTNYYLLYERRSLMTLMCSLYKLLYPHREIFRAARFYHEFKKIVFNPFAAFLS